LQDHEDGSSSVLVRRQSHGGSAAIGVVHGRRAVSRQALDLCDGYSVDWFE
jgi:hypothetical protein